MDLKMDIEPGRIEWQISEIPVDYAAAVEAMERRVAAISAGTASELVWLLEHPPLYTAGTSARAEDLLDRHLLPVHRTGRGGRYTYHGPGQRVAYLMLDLRRRGRDVRCHVHQLEEWMIRTLARFDVLGERRVGRVGIWVVRPDGGEDKIAAIGVRVRRWVTYHGVALNVAPELDHYRGIVPCGIAEHGVTSLAALGVAATMGEIDAALHTTFREVFGVESGRETPCSLPQLREEIAPTTDVAPNIGSESNA
jgi:lipoyl(octanoyl) transferase